MSMNWTWMIFCSLNLNIIETIKPILLLDSERESIRLFLSTVIFLLIEILSLDLNWETPFLDWTI